LPSISTGRREGDPALAVSLGDHLLADLLDCDPRRLARLETVRPLLVRAVEESGATPLRYSCHQFEPGGVTALALIAESHVAIHTWPERNFAGVDVFTCGESMDPHRAVQVIAEGLGARRVRITRVPRGIPR